MIRVTKAQAKKLGVVEYERQPVGVLIATLPFPPSVNHYWRHVGRRTLISRKGREFRKVVATDLTYCGRLTGRLSISIIVFPPDRRRRDLDNLLKSLLDAIQHAGVIEDDGNIDRISMERSPSFLNGVRVELRTLE